jgi:plastocyanin
MKYIGLFILLIVLVALSGCTQETAAPTTVTPTDVVTTGAPSNMTIAMTMAPTPRVSMTPSTKITTIHIRNNTYVPNELTVLPGTGIRWINDDSVMHIVKASGDHVGMFTSSGIMNGGQYGYTFGETPGIYEFTDPGYPNMKGAIIVKKSEPISGAPIIQTPTKL